MKIYKLIYYYFFLKSLKKNDAPEIPVYAMLSFVQTNNLIALINIILIITRVNIAYDILKLVIVGPIIFYIINYYYFSKKGNGAIIIKNTAFSLGKYSFLLDLFNIMSVILVVITYYIYKEY